ncbi:MAG: hypothetical protein M3R00_04860, partial [Pseudomonadota bacterium]|nr:hypothetical protein [Pseudomonadota bacterium]
TGCTSNPTRVIYSGRYWANLRPSELQFKPDDPYDAAFLKSIPKFSSIRKVLGYVQAYVMKVLERHPDRVLLDGKDSFCLIIATQLSYYLSDYDHEYCLRMAILDLILTEVTVTATAEQKQLLGLLREAIKTNVNLAGRVRRIMQDCDVNAMSAGVCGELISALNIYDDRAVYAEQAERNKVIGEKIKNLSASAQDLITTENFSAALQKCHECMALQCQISINIDKELATACFKLGCCALFAGDYFIANRYFGIAKNLYKNYHPKDVELYQEANNAFEQSFELLELSADPRAIQLLEQISARTPSMQPK